MGSPIERLREAKVTGPLTEGVRILAVDRDALLALCEAVIEEQRVMEIAGNVKPGIDADAAWEAYDEAARATQAALARCTAPDAGQGVANG